MLYQLSYFPRSKTGNMISYLLAGRKGGKKVFASDAPNISAYTAQVCRAPILRSAISTNHQCTRFRTIIHTTATAKTLQETLGFLAHLGLMMMATRNGTATARIGL